ncbi:MAG: hypothetical protein AAGC99_20150, partial [Pseudomonadota bacterium]
MVFPLIEPPVALYAKAQDTDRAGKHAIASRSLAQTMRSFTLRRRPARNDLFHNIVGKSDVGKEKSPVETGLSSEGRTSGRYRL